MLCSIFGFCFENRSLWATFFQFLLMFSFFIYHIKIDLKSEACAATSPTPPNLKIKNILENTKIIKELDSISEV